MANEREAYKDTSSEETPIEKSIMAGNHDFQPLFNENIVRAVILQRLHCFFRLHLNDSALICNYSKLFLDTKAIVHLLNRAGVVLYGNCDGICAYGYLCPGCLFAGFGVCVKSLVNLNGCA